MYGYLLFRLQKLKGFIWFVLFVDDEEDDIKNFNLSATVDIIEDLEDEDEIAFGDMKESGLGIIFVESIAKVDKSLLTMYRDSGVLHIYD